MKEIIIFKNALFSVQYDCETQMIIFYDSDDKYIEDWRENDLSLDFVVKTIYFLSQKSEIEVAEYFGELTGYKHKVYNNPSAEEEKYIRDNYSEEWFCRFGNTYLVMEG